MKSAPFVMHQAGSKENVLELLDKYGEDARIIAGGQTLIPVLAMRVASPCLLYTSPSPRDLSTSRMPSSA